MLNYKLYHKKHLYQVCRDPSRVILEGPCYLACSTFNKITAYCKWYYSSLTSSLLDDVKRSYSNFLKFIFIFFLFTQSNHLTTAQDIHFSQFMYSPMNLNPAQTGNFDGAYRFTGNMRRQWSSVTIPYQTFGMSIDAKNFLRKKNIGTGLSIYQDKTGDSHFSTLQINLAGAYFIQITKKQQVSLGIQTGITQRRIDYSNLTFDNQYNGYYYDSNIPGSETFENAGRIYANLNAGLNWNYNIDERKKLSSGISLFNITRPPQSFFGNEQIKLDRRLNYNFGVQWKLNEKFDILPSALFMAQGTYREFILGTSFKYILEDNKSHYKNSALHHYRALYAGAWARTRDAGFISIGMDYDEWYFGLSYDINYSNLKPASQGRGGFEISVMYIIRNVLPKRLKYKVCPDYI